MKDKQPIDREKIKDYCKTLAKIFKQLGKDLNTTNIELCIENIMDEEKEENFGDITIIWEGREEKKQKKSSNKEEQNEQSNQA